MLSRLTNLIGWLGVALVFAGFALRFLKPTMVNVWWNLAAAGLVCVVIYIAGQWRDIFTFFTRRQTRYGTFSVASVLIVLGILVGVNYVAARQNKRWDLTTSKEFTLSDQTRKVLQGLKEPLMMHVFAKETDFGRFRDRLGEYEYASKQVKIEYVDPDKEPGLAKQYEIQSYGTVAVEYAKRIERVTTDTEQDLTNAIIKAVEGQQRKVYFVKGHGEHDTASADERVGYNFIAQQLGRENYTIEALALAQQADVPADAAVVVVAGPTSDYLQPEIDSLSRYLNKGGKVLFMLDPPDSADAKPLTNLIALVKQWGIDVHDDIVIDRSGIGQLLGRGPGMPVVLTYPPHVITERFNNVMTGFPLARSVTPSSSAPTGRTAQPLVETSAQSWADTDVKAIFERRPLEFDEKAGDKKGPISLAAAISATAPEQPPAPPAEPPTPGAPPAEPPKRETRVVVYGDSDFVANGGLGVAGNSDLFMNTVNWLAQQENLISIRPKAPEDRRVTLTQDQQSWVLLFSVIFLPGLVVGTGVYNWWEATLMHRGRNTVLLLVIGLALGAYVYFVEMKRTPVDENAETKPKVFAALDAGKIETMTIKASAGDSTLLKKVDDTWTIVEPIKSAVDAGEVSGLAAGLAGLESQRVVEEHPKDLAKFGLAQPKVDVTFRAAGDKADRRLLLGLKTPTGGDLYAKLADDPKVILVPAYLETTFDRTTFQLRDKTMLVFDRDKANALEVAVGTSIVKFAKQGEAWALTQPAARTDSAAVDGIIGRLATAQMKSLAAQEPADLATYGLNKPEVKVTIGAGSASAGLLVGGPSQDEGAYAKDASRPMVFTIEKALADDLKKGASDYRQKDLFEFKAFTGKKIEIARGGTTRTFERKKGTEKDAVEKWTQTQPAATVDATKIDDLAGRLADLRADAFVDKLPAGATVFATVSAQFGDGAGKSEQAVIHQSGADYFATRANDPGAMKLKAADLDAVTKALDAIK